MRKFLLLTCSMLISINSQAVVLEEALTSGYDNNEELQIIRQDFLSEIEQFPQAISEFMPRIRAGLDTQKSRVTPQSSLNNRTDNISRNSQRETKFIALEQNLFNGGSSAAKVKAAQHAFSASRANFYAKEQEIIINEINIYLTAVETQEKYNISKSSVKANRTQLEAMKEKFKLGESTETDVASAESGLANAEANEAVAFSNHEAAKANFRRVFGIEPVAISMPSLPANLPKSLEELTEKALKVNLRVQTTKNNIDAAKSQEYASKGALLPTVNFTVQNSRDKYNRQNEITSEVNRKSLTSTVSVNVPILQRGGAEYSDIRRAKYTTRKSAIQHDFQIKQTKANSKTIWENFQAAHQRIVAAEKGVKAAEIAYEGTVQEERLGSKTIVDVLTNETRLNDARQTKVEAKKELVLAAYNMKSLTAEVTAKAMKLPVNFFEPEKEFKSIKKKIIGF